MGKFNLCICHKCNRNFFNDLNLKYHLKYCQKFHDKSYYCLHCEQTWSTSNAYNTHFKFCGKFICKLCNIPFLTSRALDYHIANKHFPDGKKDNRKKFSCRSCKFFCFNKSDLYKHRMKQHGRGDDLQSPLWEPDAYPFENEQLKEVYEINKSFILAPHSKGKVKSTYNFPTNNLDKGFQEIHQHINEIYDQRNEAFRINLSLGLILFNSETNSYRYFIPFHNTRVLSHPRMISSRKSIAHLMNSLMKMDIIAQARKDRPSSAWKLVFISNINYYVYSTKYPIGKSNPDIPKHIKERRSIKNFESRYNLCFFQCLAHHYHNEEPPEYYFRKWIEHCNPNVNFTFDLVVTYPGIKSTDFFRLEQFFNLSIKVYSLSEKLNITKIYDSTYKADDVMYLNLVNQHLGYITNFSRYASRFECTKCAKLFSKEWSLKRHFRSCYDKKKLDFPGGFYNQTDTIFNELETFGIDVSDVEKIYPYYAVWDMEALLMKTNYKTSPNLEWVSRHLPISVSIASNIPPYEAPTCFIERDIHALINSMVTYLLEISAHLHSQLLDMWNPILSQLDAILTETRTELSENESLRPHLRSHITNKLINLTDRVKKYISQLPVIGFNSGKYDINLIRHHLIMTLHNLTDGEKVTCIKRNNSYLMLSVSNLKFIDVSNYLAPGYSYSQFLKAYGSTIEKGYFPYEWFDSYDKLDYPRLPPREAFFSKLTNSNPIESLEHYNKLLQIWEDMNMNTFADYLEYYNNLDTGPFCIALNSLSKFYFEQDINLFKDYCTLPDIARRLLFQSTTSTFSLFDSSNADLYYTFKKIL